MPLQESLAASGDATVTGGPHRQLDAIMLAAEARRQSKSELPSALVVSGTTIVNVGYRSTNYWVVSVSGSWASKADAPVVRCVRPEFRADKNLRKLPKNAKPSCR